MSVTTPAQFQAMLSAPEGTRLEFKEAKGTYPLEDLACYCVALANEGGGKIVLGVTDKRPRSIVGTQAFEEPGVVEYQLHQVLHHRIPVEEYFHEGFRVVIVHVPPRLPGTAWQYKGAYKKRAGQALTSMGDVELKAIFAETGSDFTAEIVPGAGFEDLQPEAVSEFRQRLLRKSGNQRYATMPDEQILHDCSLMDGDGINYAALILLGRAAAITRHLAQAEVIFEYRSSEVAGPAPDREEYREPFLLFHDRLWNKINLRNDRQSYQDDFFRYDIPTFDEAAIREGILNAICHRDYRLGGSVFIRQYAMRARLPALVEIGAVESQGRGKGIRYFLSRELFAEMGLPGAYTRQKGLDHETNKALLVKHLESRPIDGSPISDLGQVLPALSRKAIRRLLDELRDEGRVTLKGEKRGSRWLLSLKAPIGDKTEQPGP